MTEKSKPGPEEERIEIEGDWEDAVEKALKKKRPKNGWPKPNKGGLAMDFIKNREKATAERKAGKNKVLDRICAKTGIDKDKLIWIDSLDDGPRLRVFAGGAQKDFDKFSNRGLADYPSDRPNPSVDDETDKVISWIEGQKT